MLHRGDQRFRHLFMGAGLVLGLILGGTQGAVQAAPAAPMRASAEPPLPAVGDRSLAVVALQQRLIDAGVPVKGGADGSFGPATTRAVATFQTAKGLPATGVVDEATAVALGFHRAVAILAPGSHGSAVTDLQQRLVGAGISLKGGVDGSFGPATAAAVATFQQRKGLKVTGLVDAYTAGLLHAAVPAPAEAPPTGPALPRPGSSGSAVAALQRQLAAVGARPKGGVDGVYGAATTASIRTVQRWLGLPATGVLDQATADGLTHLAGTDGSATHPLASFPLPRTCTFWDTWGAPRFGGRHHEGVDIFARRGTPVLAVEDGTITKRRWDQPGSRGGNQLWLTGDSGTYYFYGHLDGFTALGKPGTRVTAGQQIGFAGRTGLTTVSHLHFEIHPHGGAAVNPYLTLRVTARCEA